MEGEIRIFGKITTPDGRRVQGAEITIKDSGFRNMAKTKSNDLGEYELFVQLGQYAAICVNPPKDIKFMPYWQWNFCPMFDEEIDVEFKTIELYAMSVMAPEGIFPQFVVMFRPASYSKIQKLIEEKPELENNMLPICPKIDVKDIIITVDDEEVKVLSVNEISLFTGKNNSKAVIVAIPRPMQPSMESLTKIEVSIKDAETEEMGSGVVYW